MIVNRADFAAIIGKTPPWISKLIKQGLPCRSGGGKGKEVSIHTPDAIKWMVDQAARRSPHNQINVDSSNPTMAAEQLRLTRSKADIEEIRARELAGQYLETEAVRETFAEAMVIVSTQMDGLGGRVANQLAGMTSVAEIRDLIFKETRNIRRAAADKLQKFVDEEKEESTQ
ncbi:MAG: terminase small subunit [Magnetococcales bacterium]|nr:terminase small subunit [Magnetococcales bacterium]